MEKNKKENDLTKGKKNRNVNSYYHDLEIFKRNSITPKKPKTNSQI